MAITNNYIMVSPLLRTGSTTTLPPVISALRFGKIGLSAHRLNEKIRKVMDYRIIPRQICAALSPSDIMVYLHLWFHADFTSGRSVVLHDTLVQSTHLSPSTIHRALDRMEQQGLISQHHTSTPDGQQRKTNYTIVIPTCDFVFVRRDMLTQPVPADIAPAYAQKLRGFMVAVKCLCLNGTSECHWSQRQMEPHMHLCRQTIGHYLGRCTSLGWMQPLPDASQHGFRITLPALSMDTQRQRVPQGEPDMYRADYRLIEDYCLSRGIRCPPYDREAISCIRAEVNVPYDYVLDCQRQGYDTSALEHQCLPYRLKALALRPGTTITSLRYFCQCLCGGQPPVENTQPVFIIP